MWRQFEEADKRRAERLPNVNACLLMLLDVKQRLETLGWSEGVDMPKDGRTVKVIEWGSTGVFDCYYSGDWPDGYFNTMDDRDVYPSSSPPLMYQRSPATPARQGGEERKG